MLLIFPSSVMAQASYPFYVPEIKTEYQKGVSEGELAAKNDYSPTVWVAAGFGGGLGLGLIGSGIVAGISQVGTVEPTNSRIQFLSLKTLDFRKGYFDGYSKKAKRKKLIGSIVGGLVGTATIVIILTHGGKY
jgi:hypothetical protein